MTRIATYVFLDLETTGIPAEEYNKTRITEMCLIAVKRQHLLDTEPGSLPSVLHKLTQCFNPRRMVSWGSVKGIGLCNDLLEHEPPFNAQVFSMIDTFLSVLSQPVCLIAHNGIRYDYPILKNHIEKLNAKFSVDILCADSLTAFYDILNNKTLKESTSDSEVTTAEASDISAIEHDDTVNRDLSSFNNIKLSIKATNESTPKKTQSCEIKTGNVFKKSIVLDDSTTPEVEKSKISANNSLNITSNARRNLFYGSDERPSESYTLGNIYKRVLGKRAKNAHRAENDCLFILEICVNLSERFVEWIDKNHRSFSSIVPMTVGVPMSTISFD